jgi:hypothetical protein
MTGPGKKHQPIGIRRDSSRLTGLSVNPGRKNANG